MENTVRSGDFLRDVDITLFIRSAQTDLVVLEKLIQAFSASVTSLVDTEIVLSEKNISVKLTSDKRLNSLSCKFYID